MIDLIGFIPEIWYRIFSYCDADVLGRLLLASYHAETLPQLHRIAHEVIISNLHNRITYFEKQSHNYENNHDGKQQWNHEDKLKQFIKQLSCHQGMILERDDDRDSMLHIVDQSLKCCVLWSYIDLMISINENNFLKDQTHDKQTSFVWTIATGQLKADFYDPTDDPFHAEVMEVDITSPFSWDPNMITKMNLWMRKGVHTNMYVTPLFSEDSVQNRVGLVTQMNHDRDIRSYSFMHGNLGSSGAGDDDDDRDDNTNRWSHALVLGDEDCSKMHIWAETHRSMDNRLQEKFEQYTWVLEEAKTNPHTFLCTWQESNKADDELDSDAVIHVLKNIIIHLKQFHRQ